MIQRVYMTYGGLEIMRKKFGKVLVLGIGLGLGLVGCSNEKEKDSVAVISETPVTMDAVGDEEPKVTICGTETAAPVTVEPENTEGVEDTVLVRPSLVFEKDGTMIQSMDMEHDLVFYNIQSVSVKKGEYPELAISMDRFFEEKRMGFEKKLQEYIKEAEEYVSYGEGTEVDLYTIEQTVQLGRIDNSVVSLELDYYDYHGETDQSLITSGVTFDVKTGKVLELTDVVKDWENFEAVAADYATTSLTQRYEGKLLDGYREYVKEHWETVDWLFTDYGIRVLYTNGEIAPENKGTLEVNIPYCVVKDCIKDDYLPDSKAACMFRIPDDETFVLNFGEQDQICGIQFSQSEEYGYLSEANLFVDGKAYSFLEEPATQMNYYGEYYFARNEVGKPYLLATFVGDNDWKTTYVYQLEGDKLVEVDCIDGGIIESKMKSSEFEIQHKVDILGTYCGIRTYHLSDSGKIEVEDEKYNIENYPGSYFEYYMTVKSEVPAVIDGTETKLRAGKRIYPMAVDDKKFYFQVEGKEGYLEYERSAEYVYEIAGKNEMDVFERVLYAG